MTAESVYSAAPLLTDADLDERVRSLVGSALNPSQLWLMTLDAERRQDPVVMPISDIPVWPGATVLSTLQMVLAGVREAYGNPTMLFVLERIGSAELTSNDRAWAHQLRQACTLAGVELGGIWVADDAEVQRMPSGRRSSDQHRPR